MKALIMLAASAAITASSFAAPQFALAQSARAYGSADICAAERRSKANTGTAVGAIVGGILGSQVAGHGARTEGTVLGAGIGAVAGHQIGKHSVKCSSYPSRVSVNAYQRNNCHWVTEYYGGRNHQFEVCRSRDGVWRPSGRA